MKTYLEYYNDWQNSTESRDLSFEEWLMLQLDRKEEQMIDKAKRAFCRAKECVPYDKCQRANGGCFAMQRFIQAMEE